MADAMASKRRGSSLPLVLCRWMAPTSGVSPPCNATPSWFSRLWHMLDSAP
eukprot:CAMPEP_0173317362 /NCGR_PEP_ID=MMETSP1143-20121109/27036_1 /TAXON_ID=483371 /ORGANISM="non described non described, Strain CCMP2298" /LENGTH=50 /DNA_ID=CAMNT_0014260441 /DNA_START=231 /DNA_END=379 /DNA_ORIENTATION=+